MKPGSGDASSASVDEEKKIDCQFTENVATDDASGFEGAPPCPDLTPAQQRRAYRKVDLRLLPILTVMYLASFLDRGNIGNAKLQGLTTQLHLDGNKYNIALTMFFIPYCIFEFPSNLVLKKFRPSRWLPGITIVWGIIVTLMGLNKTYAHLVGTRIALGVAEAGLFPGVVYYLTMWYPRHMLQKRIAIFYGGATIAGAFSGLLAFGISYMSGIDGLLGWSWIFIIEGLATIVVGLVAVFVLVDFPDTAKFLDEDERAFIIWKKKYDNSSVGESEDFAMRHVWAAFKDWQVWIHVLIFLSVVCPLYGISLFLPSIIHGFGYNTTISQLLTVPPYVFAAIILMLFAYWSDRTQMRYPFILGGLALCLVGFTINISGAPMGAKYFGTYLCVAGSYAALPGVVAWLGNNLAGQYKRGVGMALHIGIGNLSGAIASNIYRSQDAPRYIFGHGLELMFIGIGFVIIPITVLIYTRINANREAKMREMEKNGVRLTPEEIRELGDRAPDFRYTI